LVSLSVLLEDRRAAALTPLNERWAISGSFVVGCLDADQVARGL
jgi:hypothetical protein